MNKTLIFIILCALGVLYMAPTASNSLPWGIQSTLYTIPRTYYAAAGLLIGVIATAALNEPSKPREPQPEKKINLKKREPQRDEQLEKLAAYFNPKAKQEPTPTEEPPPVAFDLDKEFKLAMIKLANANGAPTPSVDPDKEMPPYADH